MLDFLYSDSTAFIAPPSYCISTRPGHALVCAYLRQGHWVLPPPTSAVSRLLIALAYAPVSCPAVLMLHNLPIELLRIIIEVRTPPVAAKLDPALCHLPPRDVHLI